MFIDTKEDDDIYIMKERGKLALLSLLISWQQAIKSI